MDFQTILDYLFLSKLFEAPPADAFLMIHAVLLILAGVFFSVYDFNEKIEKKFKGIGVGKLEKMTLNQEDVVAAQMIVDYRKMQKISRDVSNNFHRIVQIAVIVFIISGISFYLHYTIFPLILLLLTVLSLGILIVNFEKFRSVYHYEPGQVRKEFEIYLEHLEPKEYALIFPENASK